MLLSIYFSSISNCFNINFCFAVSAYFLLYLPTLFLVHSMFSSSDIIPGTVYALRFFFSVLCFPEYLLSSDGQISIFTYQTVQKDFTGCSSSLAHFFISTNMTEILFSFQVGLATKEDVENIKKTLSEN